MYIKSSTKAILHYCIYFLNIYIYFHNIKKITCIILLKSCTDSDNLKGKLYAIRVYE